MRILRFGCTGYKAFKGTTEIEVRPLTLFIGKNNSGKSALLRLPRLLLRALSNQAPRRGFPLEVDGLSYGRVLTDLIHGSSPHGDVSFSIALENDAGEVLDLAATVQHLQRTAVRRNEPIESEVVSHWELKSPQKYELKWSPDPNAIGSYENVGPVHFRGLLPDTLDERWRFLQSWRLAVQDFESQVTHLGPLRSEILPTYNIGPQASAGAKGEGAIGWLAQDEILKGFVGKWYQEYLGGWRLDLDWAGSAYHCVLTRGKVTVNLCDAGQGMQQVLPIIIQQIAHSTQPQRGFLDLIEQPELHLHAAAQAELADLFLDSTQGEIGTLIVETHSENILLRIRRRIAERRANKDQIALYWVDEKPEGYSEVRRIEISADGEVDDWPEGVFAEDYEEVVALREAQLAHSHEAK